MANKISTIIDFDTTASKTKLSSFKSAIDEADGASGKMKAGFGAAKDAIVANAGAIAIGAGASLVAFGAKAVGAFTDTAKAAIDLSTSTGLSIEEASRWIGVGDDYLVSAEALATGLGKISKTLDDTKWAEYGIATRDAAGQARPANAILLDTFDMLSGITNKTEQARVGQALFGKGYQSLTPILGHTRAEYEKMLGAVEKGQVITEEEAVKAEKWRLAQDQLKDAIHEVTLAVGGIVASGAPVITFFANAVDKTVEWRDALDELTKNSSFQGFFGTIADNVKGVAGAFTDMKGKVEDVFKYGPFATDVPDRTKEVTEKTKDMTDAVVTASGEFVNSQNTAAGYSYAVQSVSDAEQKAKDDAAKLTQHLGFLEDQWDDLTGKINADKTWLDLQTGFDDLKVKSMEAWDAAIKGADDATVKSRDYQTALADQKLAVIDYGKEVLKLPIKQVTEIQALVDQGKFDEAEAMLQRLARQRAALFQVDIVAGGNKWKVVAAAAGGRVPGGPTLVGEQGPELVDLPSGSNVHTAAETRGMLGAGGDTFVLNMPVGINDRDLMRALQKLKARNGPAFLVS